MSGHERCPRQLEGSSVSDSVSVPVSVAVPVPVSVSVPVSVAETETGTDTETETGTGTESETESELKTTRTRRLGPGELKNSFGLCLGDIPLILQMQIVHPSIDIFEVELSTLHAQNTCGVADLPFGLAHLGPLKLRKDGVLG